jgi:enoyl-[acyl-carrier protein] reductase III
MTLEDQVVAITGASRGIGRAIALRLAREGPRHIVVGYTANNAAARKTVDELEELGVEATTVRVDVAREPMLHDMFGQIRDELGRLDVFVSNAARTSFRPAMELNSRSWQKIMDINARAFLLGSQLAAELMRENGGGRIIGISSIGSQFALPDYSALGVAKAAIETLARYLAVELAPWGINVNVVSGGFVDTQSMRLARDYRQLVEHLVAVTPAGRVATADDLAGVVAFLCSPESDWIRGQTIVADGGYSIAVPYTR